MATIFTVTVEWEDDREGQWLENLQVAAFDAADAEALAKTWLNEHEGFASEVRIHAVNANVGYEVSLMAHGVVGHLVVNDAAGTTSWESFGRAASKKQAIKK